MPDSDISGLYRLSVPQRIAELNRLGWLSADAASDLSAGRQVVSVAAADKMIENVVGVFALPLAVAPNFIVNGEDRLLPLVVEEPSIVAALSNAAQLARASGGFVAELAESLLIGQLYVTGFTDGAARDRAIAKLERAEDQLLRDAEDVHPRLLQRGGGVRELEFRKVELEGKRPIIAVHLHVDTSDAMGANLVNTLCEALAGTVGRLCGGDVVLKILSNLADRSVVKASVTYATEQLATDAMSGAAVRDRIVLASDIALVDPYRAATHNKGIMNGIDAIALATGNDWRAIEAGAHAFAARDGQYRSLTRWRVAANGDLCGTIEIPIKPGVVGGTLATNPAAALGLAISGAGSAQQLAEMMAAAGLAQNFSALRALASSGIQRGHMRLHARSLANAAGANDSQLDTVVEELIASGDIKDWKAREIVASLSSRQRAADAVSATAAGKLILFGEHAVVYGRHAVALPIPNAVRASVSTAESATTIAVPGWGLNTTVGKDSSDGIEAAVRLVLERLDLESRHFHVAIDSDLPRGMGLGSSAAIAVAVTRGVAACVGLELSANDVNAIAFDCEKIAHGTPSGIDNTLSCYAEPIQFRNDGELHIRTLRPEQTPALVVGFSHSSGPTHTQVAGVRSRYDLAEQRFNALFDQIDEIALAGVAALEAGDLAMLGTLMNLNQGLLNAIGVSTPELEHMLGIARDAGATGAKLTGAGGGGSIIALCPGSERDVSAALHRSGYESILLDAGQEQSLD